MKNILFLQYFLFLFLTQTSIADSINKNLEPFSNYNTSLTTPKEVNTLDTTDSIYKRIIENDSLKTIRGIEAYIAFLKRKNISNFWGSA